MSSASEELLQASAVAIDGSAVLITGLPGSGKSTLALALVDRGADLIGDDGVLLRRKGDEVIAHPPPNITGLLEIRGVGLVRLPAVSARLTLIVSLDEHGERLPEALPAQRLCDRPFPLLGLAGSDPASRPLRTEWALRIHGRSKD